MSLDAHMQLLMVKSWLRMLQDERAGEATRASVLKLLRDVGTKLTREHVPGFRERTIDDLVNEWPLHGYRPSVASDADAEHVMLADIYDVVAVAMGVDVIAYRSSPQPAGK